MMDRGNNARSFAHGYALAGLAAALAAPVPAAGQAQGFAIEEVVVTARKREESLQNTPVAVSAFTANDLKFRQVQATDKLADIAPNLRFDPVSPSSGSNSAGQIFIRGIGQTDFTPVTDPGVGLYIDGVYMARSVGAVMDFVDVERIEVLRGPQGTLFGRNTIGGAILVHTRKPADTFQGDVSAEFGSDKKNYWTAHLDVPFSETLKTNYAFTRRNRNGYMKRLADGLDGGDENMWAARGSALWTPRADFEALVAMDYTNRRENGPATVSGGVNDLQAFAGIANIVNPACPPPPPGDPVPGPGYDTMGNPACANDTAFIGPFTSGGTFPIKSSLDTWGVHTTLTWDATDWLQVKSITGYRYVELLSSRDGDNTPNKIFATRDHFKQKQWSQELQLSGRAFADRLQWLLGGYYFWEDATNINPVFLPVGDLQSGGSATNESYAIFTQGTYDLTEALSITFGVRYSNDTKQFRPNQKIFGPALIAPVYLGPGGITVPVGGRLLPLEEFEVDFDDFSILANAAYQWTDELMTYFTYSEGFKSGGFDQRFVVPLTEPSSFKPEFVESYEIGVKSEWFDNRLRLNVAAFHTDYDGLHIVTRETFNPITFNAGTADIDGFEIEAVVVPHPDWFITGAIGYLDAEYKSLDQAAINAGVREDNELINSPEWSTSLGVAYTVRISEWGTMTPRLDWAYHASEYNNAVNTPQLKQDSYHMLNMAATFESDDGQWQVTLAGRNLLDETYLITGNSGYETASSYLEQVYGRPREWSLSVQYNF